jgi:starch synthase
VHGGYHEHFAHRITAGADVALTPSRFEPCGLTTMYAMPYGAIPVTRPVGGLADTVSDADTSNADDRRGTGFVFELATPKAFADCIERAATRYQKRPWRSLQQRAMKRDFGWERSAGRYLELYTDLVGRDTRKTCWSEPDDAARFSVIADAANDPIDPASDPDNAELLVRDGR